MTTDGEPSHGKVLWLDQAAMFATIDGWMELTSRSSPAVEAGSPLYGDARRSRIHQVAHAAWNGIAHAIDQQHALKTLIADARMLHLYAPFSLIRSATENAATSVWLLKEDRPFR